MSVSQPNIVLITTDQQRYDTCGPRAPRWMRTPHFDDLCRSGIRFDAAYGDCPICVAARTSIMTGKTVNTHGLMGNEPTSKYFGDKDTLPTVMRELGYQTAAIGKMHFGPERRRHGWEEMILPADYYRQMERSGLPFQPMRHGLGQNELYPTMATVPEALTLTSWTAERCVDYIRERRDPTKPFLLWCSFSKPHPPLDPPEPYYSMYRDCDIPAPIIGDWSGDDAPEGLKRSRQEWSTDLLSSEIIRAARVAYYGLITQCDYNMGRIFAALQDLGLLTETLILYCSDHGELLGDHHAGAKSYPYEGAAHVPFALRLPASWDRHAGASIKSPVTHADILPTFAAAAGGKAPEECDGQNLLAVIRGEAPARRYLEAVHPNRITNSLTDGRWKYIYFPEGGREQLFDLETDPDEITDLAGEEAHAAKRDEMRAELTRLHQERGSNVVENGALVVKPVRGDSEAERRARPWPGYHTEHFGVDVRH